jgi:hypothetical protein
MGCRRRAAALPGVGQPCGSGGRLAACNSGRRSRGGASRWLGVQRFLSGCNISPAGATSCQRVQHFVSGCSILSAGAAFSQRVQHSVSGCSIFPAGATFSQRVQHSRGVWHQLRAVNLSRWWRVCGVCASVRAVISRRVHLAVAGVPRRVDSCTRDQPMAAQRGAWGGRVASATSARRAAAGAWGRGAACVDRPGRVLVVMRCAGLCAAEAPHAPHAHCAAQCKK